jgi:hypothetical protein
MSPTMASMICITFWPFTTRNFLRPVPWSSSRVFVSVFARIASPSLFSAFLFMGITP